MTDEIVLRDSDCNVSSLQEELGLLYTQGFLTDCTLSTEDGKNFEAHRVLLAARSGYFHDIFPRLKSDPVIFLKGVKGLLLDKVLKFIYGGSVHVTRQKLKPLVELARSLQIKGLQDTDVSEAAKSGYIVAGNAQQRRESPSPEKGGANSGGGESGKQSRGGTRLGGHGAGHHGRGGKPVGRQEHSSPERDSEVEPPRKRGRPKGRGRGRPPKKPVVAQEEVSEDDVPLKINDKIDPYTFSDNEDSDVVEAREEPPSPTIDTDVDDASDDRPFLSASRSGRHFQQSSQSYHRNGSSKLNGVRQNEASSPEVDNNSEKQRDSPSPSKRSSTNRNNILTIKCKGKLAELHMNKFANGTKGNSVFYKNTWMTPNELLNDCACGNKKYLELITTDYGPLRMLTVSGMLKPHPRKCTCPICKEDSPTKPSEKVEESRETADGSRIEEDAGHDESHKSSSKSKDGSSRKKKKKIKDEPAESPEKSLFEKIRYSDSEDDERTVGPSETRQADRARAVLASEPVADGPSPGASAGALVQATAARRPQSSIKSEATTASVEAKGTLLQVSNRAISSASFVYSETLRPEGVSESKTVATTMNNTTSNVLTPATLNASALTSKSQSTPPVQTHFSRIGSIMQVRCKSSHGLLYANRYESGSKGKCIQFNNDWLTPNQFELLAGSKAKKYLSSIKCLGRPLRHFVNSGELKGTSPPRPRKVTVSVSAGMGNSTPKHQMSTPQHLVSPNGTFAGAVTAHVSQSGALGMIATTPQLSLAHSTQVLGNPVLVNANQYLTQIMRPAIPALQPM